MFKSFIQNQWPGLIVLLVGVAISIQPFLPGATGVVTDQYTIENRKVPSNPVAEWLIPTTEYVLEIETADQTRMRVSVPEKDWNKVGTEYAQQWDHNIH